MSQKWNLPWKAKQEPYCYSKILKKVSETGNCPLKWRRLRKQCFEKNSLPETEGCSWGCKTIWAKVIALEIRKRWAGKESRPLSFGVKFHGNVFSCGQTIIPETFQFRSLNEWLGVTCHLPHINSSHLAFLLYIQPSIYWLALIFRGQWDAVQGREMEMAMPVPHRVPEAEMSC